MTFPVNRLKLSPWLPGTVPYVARSVFPRVAVLVGFSGGGALAGPVTGFDVGFTGQGTLSVTVNSVFPVFAGEGTLRAVALIGSVNVDAQFGGDGLLAGSVAVPSTAVFPELSGVGVLSATATVGP
jgi:hypothetical protein